jgi:hypothetical protein
VDPVPDPLLLRKSGSHNLYSSPSIIVMIKSRSEMGRAYSMNGEKRNAYRILAHSESVCLSLMLRPTVSRPVCPGTKHPSGAYDQIFISL